MNVGSLEYLDPLGKRLAELMKPLDYNATYNLYADEGGMIGIPRYIISKRTVKRPHFEHMMLAKRYTIKDFIERSIITWAATCSTDSMDYSKTFTIEIIK